MVVKYRGLTVLNSMKYCKGICFQNIAFNAFYSTAWCTESLVYNRVLPLQVAIDKRIIRYWFGILSKHDSYCLYRMALIPLSNKQYKTY